ncbi:MAG: energy transducer TonB [Blastocatellia bacterium]|nr:energy transducer TonB [Blastocatellia bacterium]
MAKILKFCSSCDEGFAAKFTFCPDCGSVLKAYELNPVASEPAPLPEPVTKEVSAFAVPLDLDLQRPDTSSLTAESAGGPIAGEPIVEEPPIFVDVPAAVEPVMAADTYEQPAVTEAAEIEAAELEAAEAEIQTGPLDLEDIREDEEILHAYDTDADGNVDAEPLNEVPAHSTPVYHQPNAVHADEVRPAYAVTREDDGGYYVTVIQESNGKQRNALLLGATAFVLIAAIGGWGISLFNKDLGVGYIGDDIALARLIDDVPMPIEEEEQPKDKDEGGGGGGGGRDEPEQTSKGQLAQQNEKPLLAPTKTIIQRDNPELVQIATTEGRQTPPRTDERYGDPNSKFLGLSDGTGTGGGQGSGTGTGQGSGTGTGMGSGTGSGSGSGTGTGDGSGRGSGTGGAPPPAPVRPPRVTTDLRIISKPRAQYTDTARQNQVQGTVRLRVTFLPTGQIGSISTVSGLPGGLTEQAIAAARQLRFEPRKVDGVAVAVVRQVEYNFTLY